ncbi:MAG: hypothetical protein ACTSUK_06850 [Promethearchaeota archaeon]
MGKGEIRICTGHDVEIPLIWTFAFNGAEYWCPYCGANYGMMGAGTMVESTMALKRKLVADKKETKEYLGAKSSQVCVSTMWKGERISPEDLPDEEKFRLQTIIDEFVYPINKT